MTARLQTQVGQIIFQERIFRNDLLYNPSKIFVFGDNLMQKGLGGQAAEMRGEHNAFGIPTKRTPSMAEAAFFADRQDEIIAVKRVLHILDGHFVSGRIIVVPRDGVGTGLAQLPQRSPLVNQMIRSFLGARCAGNLPW